MSPVLVVLRRALADTWNAIATVLLVNLFWLLSQLLIIPGPPATLAIFYYANRLAHQEAADFADFWRAFRSYWGPAWRWGLLTYLVIAILFFDERLTGRTGAASPAIQGFYLALLSAWLLLQLFTLPLLFEQDRPSLRQALRNAAVMLGRNIVFSVLLGVLLSLLLLAGIPLFMLTFAFGGMLLASAGNHAVIDRLEAEKEGEAVPSTGRGLESSPDDPNESA